MVIEVVVLIILVSSNSDSNAASTARVILLIPNSFMNLLDLVDYGTVFPHVSYT